MHNITELILQRQSCRNFDSTRPVERETLMAVMEAARLAPSACNGQPWRYIVVDDPARVEQTALCLQDAGMNRFAQQATAFAVLLEGSQSLSARVGGSLKNQNFSGMDMGISVAHLVLAAADMGLASCIMGWLNERKLKMLLGIPKTKRIRLVVALGYAMPDDPLRPKERKPFDEVVSFNRF